MTVAAKVGLAKQTCHDIRAMSAVVALFGGCLVLSCESVLPLELLSLVQSSRAPLLRGQAWRYTKVLQCRP